MDTHENYKRQGMTEGNPGNINPDEINRTQPAKAISETEKLERNESALGINQSHKASSELDQQISQIDEETKKMKQKASDELDQESDERLTREDDRDHNNSSEDWDAENNRTGRHK